MPDLLFEAGMEEIPARMIAAAEAELTERVTALLRRERLLGEPNEVHSYSTPRRLAVQVSGVLERQPDVTERVTGPAWGVAFREEQPTAAAQAFARKAGVAVEALEKVATPKGEYVSATVTHSGRRAPEVLGERLAAELAALYWPKNMYWRAGKPERFVRPVRWMVAMLNHEEIPVEFAGVRAGRQTFGHPILHGSEPVVIDHPDDYLGVLEAAQVTAEVALRRHRIRKALDQETRGIPGARWREDAALVETVTHLTEWPSVVMGSFDREYLTLPEEVLVTVMRDHQKYFAVENPKGRLEPYFLAVLNTHPEETGAETIRHGNERVLRARFNDARFFWDVDQKTALEDRVEMLKSVTFHKELGSYRDKTQANLRIAESLAGTLAERGVSLDAQALNQAVRAAKADLTTELVREFTELQGIVGGLYARAQGLGETVAQAIYWQYSPAALEDPIPPAVEGQVLGLADRIQTMVAMFGIGLEPTGSKDPFALRRAANAIVKILAESELPLTISDLLSAVAPEADIKANQRLVAFFGERVEFYLREARGFTYDVVNAVVAADADDVRDAIARADALTAVRGSEDLAAISAAFKRIRNILRQATEKGMIGPGRDFGFATMEDHLQEPAERALFEEASKLIPKVEELRRRREYRPALEAIATLRPHVDLFFDKVMVMVEDAPLRDVRLNLIGWVLQTFSRIADFSELVSAS
ncbi:MAG TPA: glycine--tRNA ligase subunit beta [Acidobacteriaceae bacterium]|nr:glycine--tRNA ligase subunit beta [Acidobacteriaceae bacterium]